MRQRISFSNSLKLQKGPKTSYINANIAFYFQQDTIFAQNSCAAAILSGLRFAAFTYLATVEALLPVLLPTSANVP